MVLNFVAIRLSSPSTVRHPTPPPHSASSCPKIFTNPSVTSQAIWVLNQKVNSFSDKNVFSEPPMGVMSFSSYEGSSQRKEAIEELKPFAKMDCYYLSCPSTHICPECIFGTRSNAVTDHRTAKLPENMDWLTFIKINHNRFWHSHNSEAKGDLEREVD